MYVCICNGVTESDIERAVDEGCNSLHHLQSRLGVSSQCGSCACDAKACLERSMENQMASDGLVNI